MGAGKGAGAIDATPLPGAPDLTVISCSATDWLAELDGGPGGSDAAVDRLLGSEFAYESGSDVKSSDSFSTLILTWWVTISRSKLARSREIRRLARSRERREWRR